MNRKFDNEVGPSAKRIDTLIDSFNTDDAHEPDVDPDLTEIAATIRGLRRRRAIVWPERLDDVPRLMAHRLAEHVQPMNSSSSSNDVYFASSSSSSATDWDHAGTSDDYVRIDTQVGWTDLANQPSQVRQSRVREALTIAAAIIGFGILAAGLIAIFQPGDGNHGNGAAPEALGTGEILYVGIPGDTSDIMVINDDGSNPRNLTNDPAGDYWPEWSPDGQMIAFVSNQDGNHRIHVMRSDGSDRRPATTPIPGDQYLPVWSPDGSQLAFQQINPPDENGNVRVDVAVVDLATGSWRTVALAGEHPDSLGTVAMKVAWSPDGKWLAFTHAAGPDTDPELVVVRPSGAQTVRYPLEDGFAVQPAWSPDGRYLAYGIHGTISKLIVRDFLTDKIIQTVPIAANQIIELTWSADGSELYFSTSYTSTGDILKMSAATGAISKVTDWIGREYIMDISPDGSQLVVLFVPPASTRAEDSNAASSELIVMNIDGSDQLVLAKNVDVPGSWRP